MNVCLQSVVTHALANLKGKRWAAGETSPAWGMTLMNDIIKAFVDAKPEELPELQASMKEFLGVDRHPLYDYGTINHGGTHRQPPVFGQPLR